MQVLKTAQELIGDGGILLISESHSLENLEVFSSLYHHPQSPGEKAGIYQLDLAPSPPLHSHVGSWLAGRQ